MESLNDKLRSLGVTLGPKQEKSPVDVTSAKYPIEKVIPQGEVVYNTNGGHYHLVECYPYSHIQGRVPIYQAAEMDIIGKWAKIEGLRDIPLEKFVFMDTETTGLAGGTGTMAFMVGLGFYDGENYQLHQYFLRGPEDEVSMLTAIDELMAPFEVVVSYNGRSFDVPLLNTRYVINRMTSPFAELGQVDLLHLARKIWKKRLANRTLGMMENEILQFFRSEEEVPGWMAPELYYDYLRSGDAREVSRVFYHNAMDIVSLAGLLVYSADILEHPFQNDDLPGLDLVSIARIYEDVGEEESALEIYQTGISQGLPSGHYVDALMRYAAIHKKRTEWKFAMDLWEKAAAEGDYQACEELAKFEEHQNRNYEKAMEWVNRGFEIVEQLANTSYERKQKMDALQHRLERLLEKWQKSCA